jgi:microcystin-dependent protein
LNSLIPLNSARAGYITQDIRDFKVEASFCFAEEIVVGEICSWPSDSIPDGFLECDGSAISRTTYQDLFDVIGSIYGDGDSYTTFNIPDLRGLTIRGQDSGAGIDEASASRSDRGDGATGDFVGTKQGGETSKHNHKDVRTSILGSGSTSSSTTTAAASASQGGNDSNPPNMVLKFIIRFEMVQDGR